MFRITRITSLVILCLTVAVVSQGQARHEPRFEEFRADVWHGQAAPLNLRSHRLARLYRTSIRQQLQEEGINFAGHYSLVVMGCGTGCSIAAIVDARNGRAFFPRALDGWTSIVGDYEIPEGEDIRTFHANSRLVKAIGRPRLSADERWGPSGIYYYEWAGNSLRLVKFTQVGSYPEADPPAKPNH